MDNIFADRVEQIRSLMSRRGWDAVLISGSDPHSSEYPAPRWKQVEWVSGFTGEAGDLVITADHAGLWTDTRYFIAANRQLAGTGIELHKTRVPEQVLIPQWLAGHFPAKRKLVVALDGLCWQSDSVSEICAAFEAAGRLSDEDSDLTYRLVSAPDFLDLLWEDRPAIPYNPIESPDEALFGESRAQKIEWLRRQTAMLGCDAFLITALDEIAWLLNVRGSDIEYNPMVISYLLVDSGSVKWFVRKGAGRCSPPQLEGVEVLPYDDLEISLNSLLGDDSHVRIAVDPSTLNFHLHCLLRELGGSRVLECTSPIGLRKAVKNTVEADGFRRAHREDGVVMEKFLYWLETQVHGSAQVTEWDAAQCLQSLRAEVDGYRGDSFETISAYGQSAALPHYVTPRSSQAPLIEPHGLYLCDSGGQYIYGTTDITRTVPMGECTRLEKEDYTLVLKGHIQLSSAVWPYGTAGCQIDALARMPLWKAHRNFGHGTGHGVGFWLGVHEGPHDIRQNFNKTTLLPGMVVSIEPGIYREGQHGVRHENLVLCREDGTDEFGRWLCFEPLTLCHIDTGAVLPDMLTFEEKEWLNWYNDTVYRNLAPLLPEHIADWLLDKTKPI